MFKTDSNTANLTAAIDKLLTDMSNEDPTSDQFAIYLGQLDSLIKTRKTLAEAKAHGRLSGDVMATVAANLAGIMMIVGHERAAVVTSQAMKVLMKIRA